MLQQFMESTRLQRNRSVSEERSKRLEGILSIIDQDALENWKRDLIVREVERLADVCAWEARNEVTVKIRRPTGE